MNKKEFKTSINSFDLINNFIAKTVDKICRI